MYKCFILLYPRPQGRTTFCWSGPSVVKFKLNLNLNLNPCCMVENQDLTHWWYRHGGPNGHHAGKPAEKYCLSIQVLSNLEVIDGLISNKLLFLVPIHRCHQTLPHQHHHFMLSQVSLFHVLFAGQFNLLNSRLVFDEVSKIRLELLLGVGMGNGTLRINNTYIESCNNIVSGSAFISITNSTVKLPGS